MAWYGIIWYTVIYINNIRNDAVLPLLIEVFLSSFEIYDTKQLFC